MKGDFVVIQVMASPAELSGARAGSVAAEGAAFLEGNPRHDA